MASTYYMEGIKYTKNSSIHKLFHNQFTMYSQPGGWSVLQHHYILYVSTDMTIYSHTNSYDALAGIASRFRIIYLGSNVNFNSTSDKISSSGTGGETYCIYLEGVNINLRIMNIFMYSIHASGNFNDHFGIYQNGDNSTLNITGSIISINSSIPVCLYKTGGNGTWNVSSCILDCYDILPDPPTKINPITNDGTINGNYIDRDGVTYIIQGFTPSSNSIPGAMTYDDNFIYICTSSGVWKKATLNSL